MPLSTKVPLPCLVTVVCTRPDVELPIAPVIVLVAAFELTVKPFKPVTAPAILTAPDPALIVKTGLPAFTETCTLKPLVPRPPDPEKVQSGWAPV